MSSVQTLPSLQRTPEPEQLPPEHASPEVQAFPSSHGFALYAWTQPVDGSQESSVHGFSSSQSVGLDWLHWLTESVTTIVSMFCPDPPVLESVPRRNRSWIVWPAAAGGRLTLVV